MKKLLSIFRSFSICILQHMLELLDDVKNRGFLKCGVTTGLMLVLLLQMIAGELGWSRCRRMCRAVAVAVFGDRSSKVEFITTTGKSRFPTLASGEVDMLSEKHYLDNLSRDVNLGFEFVGVNFYDGQGFMVPSALRCIKMLLVLMVLQFVFKLEQLLS